MPSAEFRYALELYKYMEGKSAVEIVHNEKVTIYRGGATTAFDSIGCSKTYYSKLFKILNQQGCITQIRRGGRGVTSVYALHHPPDWTEHEFRRGTEPLTRGYDLAMLAQQIDNVVKQIGGIDIKDALADHERRLLKLEREA